MKRKFCGWLCGWLWFFCLPFFFNAILTSPDFWTQLQVYRHVGAYQAAEFRVSQIRYFPAEFRARGSKPAHWYAEGTVAGRCEHFNLAGVLHRKPESLGDLQSLIGEASLLKVLYNPNIGDRDFRVFAFSSDFEAERWQQMFGSARDAFGPLVASLSIALTFTLLLGLC